MQISLVSWGRGLDTLNQSCPAIDQEVTLSCIQNRVSHLGQKTSGLGKFSFDGTPGATRTPDTRFRKPLLYPLSYRGMVEIGGFEPPTSAMRTQRSPS
jgi:hypothetical protein